MFYNTENSSPKIDILREKRKILQGKLLKKFRITDKNFKWIILHDSNSHMIFVTVSWNHPMVWFYQGNMGLVLL